MKNQKSLGNKGFSLVELIVVIAIMAVLVGVLAPQFIKYVESSKQSTDMQNIQQIKTAIEVELTDSDITTAKIEVSGGSITVTIGDGTTTLETTSVPSSLKSSGWPSATYEYNATSGAWTGTASEGHANNNKPNKELDDIFI